MENHMSVQSRLNKRIPESRSRRPLLWQLSRTILLFSIAVGVMPDAARAIPIQNAQAMSLQQGGFVLPCKLAHSKTLSSSRVEVGDVLDVEVRFDYDCSDEVEPIHMVLMVGTSVPERFRDKRALQANLRSELSRVLDEFPYERGSTLGLVVYGEDVEQSVAPSDSPDALRRLIGRLTLEEGTSDGLDDAIAESIRLLGRASEEEPRIIAIFDNGAELTQRIVNGGRAKRAEIETAVFQLPNADSQLCEQATLGCFDAADDRGSDLGELTLRVVAEESQTIDIMGVRIMEMFGNGIAEMVPDSMNIEPSIVLHDIEYWWEIPSQPRPPEGWELLYQIEIVDKGNYAPMSSAFFDGAPEFFVELNTSNWIRTMLDRPIFCLARPDMLDVDCPQAGPSQTPGTPPPATSTPTSSPTNLPTNTPSDTATSSPTLTTNRVYLPRLIRE